MHTQQTDEEASTTYSIVGSKKRKTIANGNVAEDVSPLIRRTPQPLQVDASHFGWT